MSRKQSYSIGFYPVKYELAYLNARRVNLCAYINTQ